MQLPTLAYRFGILGLIGVVYIAQAIWYHEGLCITLKISRVVVVVLYCNTSVPRFRGAIVFLSVIHSVECSIHMIFVCAFFNFLFATHTCTLLIYFNFYFVYAVQSMVEAECRAVISLW